MIEKEKKGRRDMGKTNEKVKLYVDKITGWLAEIHPLVLYYQIIYLNEDTNEHNGDMSIRYDPLNFEVELFIYKSFIKSIPDKGLTQAFKNYIKKSLCHEFGHVYIWNLEGNYREVEKVATLIGELLYRILERKEERHAKEKH